MLQQRYAARCNARHASCWLTRVLPIRHVLAIVACSVAAGGCPVPERRPTPPDFPTPTIPTFRAQANSRVAADGGATNGVMRAEAGH
jgi:hypothetical protein